ncbi:RnfABCDGE type electron transport complex subunit G [Pseudomonas putida]|uniref:Ion-translocating oxidoreductase complex subunit G n=1 Tax=Pseudomonas putida TaxID=303 RepID=A0A4D6X4S8_PSEPU|nr:RnfABCDGE type electron transport complex subunit G [Pseudomonas putida]QCI11057.1 RnfABCDGE type electron transport complex subunit G [Pseudomonas putida]
MSAGVRSTLAVIVIAALALSATLAWRQWTEQARAHALVHLQIEQRLAVLPAQSYDNQPLDTPLALPEPQLPNSRILAGYLATLATQPTAVLLISQTQGYSSAITLGIAISPDGRLLASRVIEQQETPGLGGRLGDPQVGWLAQFANRRATDKWMLKRDHGDFDQLVGATVTSRAVMEALQEALGYFDQHRNELLGVPGHE